MGGANSGIAGRCPLLLPSLPHKRTPAQSAPRNFQRISKPRRPRDGARLGLCVVFYMSKRLSATDISALASMKNVAKCDTWCELQNPVNHRVFERKLRPKPLGRGHVCLGVTHRRPLPKPVFLTGLGGADIGLPCECVRLAQNRVPGFVCRDIRWLSIFRCPVARKVA